MTTDHNRRARRANPMSLAAGSLLLLVTPACSLFSHYPDETADAQAAFRAGMFEQSYQQFRAGAERGEGDALAWTLDAALAAHTGGLFQESRDSFEAAERVILQYRDEPSVSGRTIVDNAAALLANDKALPYDGEGFERVLVQTYQSLNYLFFGQLENAQVKARKALEVQREEEERLEKDWEIEKGSNETMNLFSRYLIGLAYESMGGRNDLENAAVAYKQVAERAGDCWLARQDVVRVYRLLGRNQEADQLAGQWGVSNVSVPGQGEGEIVLIYQCGIIPEKGYKTIAETRNGQRFTIPLPEYRDRPNPIDHARLEVAGRSCDTALVEPLDLTARKSLEDRYPSIIARAAIRVGIKIAATAVLGKVAHDQAKEGKDNTAALVGAIAVGLWGAISEQPDLRSWITLPKNFQVARLYVPPGEQTVRIALQGRGSTIRVVDVPVQVRERGRTFINLRTWDTNAFYQIANGGPVF